MQENMKAGIDRSSKLLHLYCISGDVYVIMIMSILAIKILNNCYIIAVY